MKKFAIVAAIYLCLSLILSGLMFLSNRARNQLFQSEFGGRISFEELNAEEQLRWSNIHEEKFNAGPWRVISLVWMFFHYPGIIVHAILKKDALNPIIMFVASAGIWLGIALLILRKNSG